MTTLTLSQVEYIANLARLNLTDEEKARYCEQLSAILDYFTRLQALDTTGISVRPSVVPPHAVLRPDEPHPGLARSELLRNAPAVEDEQFLVPVVLE
jgi:aspartyl-tRNA(Asn)/glutamyl-tRNA(Gln) amidotransferase subunit C